MGNSCDSDGCYNDSESCKTHRRKKQRRKDTKKGRNKDRMKEVGWAHVDLFWKQLPLRDNCFSRLHHRHWKPSLARLLPAAHRRKQTGKNNLIEGQNLIELKNCFYGQNSLGEVGKGIRPMVKTWMSMLQKLLLTKDTFRYNCIIMVLSENAEDVRMRP